MSKRYKINEAKYFYDRMDETKGNPNYFRYNLSAFLSAARSVIQYAWEEVKGGPNSTAKPGAQTWFQSEVVSRPYFDDLGGIRNKNVHHYPIDPNKDVTIQIGETLNVSESILVYLNGKLVSGDPGGSRTNARKKGASTTASHTYHFKELPDKDVFDVCKEYLDELDDFVKVGEAKGFITG